MTATERRNSRELAERQTRKLTRMDFERLILRVTELEAREAAREAREAAGPRGLHAVS